MLHRRKFLQASAALPVAALLPSFAVAQSGEAQPDFAVAGSEQTDPAGFLEEMDSTISLNGDWLLAMDDLGSFWDAIGNSYGYPDSIFD